MFLNYKINIIFVSKIISDQSLVLTLSHIQQPVTTYNYIYKRHCHPSPSLSTPQNKKNTKDKTFIYQKPTF